jgi:uncharacterized protein (DUF779 family)
MSTNVDLLSAKTFMKLLSAKRIILYVMSDCCDVSAFMIYPKMFLKLHEFSSKLIENSLKLRSNNIAFGMISEKNMPLNRAYALSASAESSKIPMCYDRKENIVEFSMENLPNENDPIVWVLNFVANLELFALVSSVSLLEAPEKYESLIDMTFVSMRKYIESAMFFANLRSLVFWKLEEFT